MAELNPSLRAERKAYIAKVLKYKMLGKEAMKRHLREAEEQKRAVPLADLPDPIREELDRNYVRTPGNAGVVPVELRPNLDELTEPRRRPR